MLLCERKFYGALSEVLAIAVAQNLILISALFRDSKNAFLMIHLHDCNFTPAICNL